MSSQIDITVTKEVMWHTWWSELYSLQNLTVLAGNSKCNCTKPEKHNVWLGSECYSPWN